MRRSRKVVGGMSGTSLDGLDLALVEVLGTGLELRAHLLHTHSVDLGDSEQPLRALARGEALTAAEICRCTHRFAELHVAAIEELLAAGDRADLICLHGQTVFHNPPLSWQLLDGAWIAQRLETPVVFDLRAADRADGGQGAPITPLADWLLLASAEESRVVVNLGGFCNYTWLPHRPADSVDSTRLSLIRGADVCACNQLLDAAAWLAIRRPFDRGGATARSGCLNAAVAERIGAALAAQSRPGRSLGSVDDVNALVAECATSAQPADLLHSACVALATTIADNLPTSDRVLVAGGGAANSFLVDCLRERVRTPLTLSDAAGVPAPYREAMAIAVLGTLCCDGVPITLPQITGCRDPAPPCGVLAPAGQRNRFTAG